MAATELSRRRAIVELCRTLEGRRLNQGTSGNVSVRHRSRGADGWLMKPLDPIRTRRAVEALLAGGRYEDATGAPAEVATPAASG